MEIHALKAQGLSERRIAKQLGISRNTVARYLDAPEAPRYKLREARATTVADEGAGDDTDAVWLPQDGRIQEAACWRMRAPTAINNIFL